jgi:cell division protein FtsB
MAEAREELIEDQAREVYQYVAEDETFVAWGDAQSPEKTKKKSS